MYVLFEFKYLNDKYLFLKFCYKNQLRMFEKSDFKSYLLPSQGLIEVEDIIEPVNRILSHYSCKTQYQKFSYYYELSNFLSGDRETSSMRELNTTALCELNVGLCDTAFLSAIHSLTPKTYPNSKIVLNFIKCLMKAEAKANFYLLKKFFNDLLISYSPSYETFEYYQKILCEPLLILNDKYVGDECLLSCVTEALINYLNEPELSQEDKQKSMFHYTELSTLIGDFSNTNFNSSPLLLQKSNFEDLPWREKVERCLVVFKFIYDILETDFMFWINSNEYERFKNVGMRPLVSLILWPQRDVGVCNKQVNQLIKLYILGSKCEKYNFNDMYIVKKFISLVAEAIRLCDMVDEVKYPHFGTKTNDYSRELSIQLYKWFEDFKVGGEYFRLLYAVRGITTPWLCLLVTSCLLGYFTGYKCSPELTSACYLLEHLTFATHIDKLGRKGPLIDSETNVDRIRVSKLKKLISVNTKIKGRTRLQAAVDANDVEEVRALLIFPELDINAVDLEGWTALHLACQRGNVKCVEECLHRTSNPRKTINVRARGPKSTTPLMCAAMRGHTEICHLLLDHSGSILLEDLNDSNQSALSLSSNEETTRILRYYKKNKQPPRTQFSNIDYDEKYKELVIGLCLELIFSYFNTYKTLEVCKAVINEGRDGSSGERNSHLEMSSQWDYMLYLRDLNGNVMKLKRLCNKLEGIQEFELANKILNSVIEKGNNE